MSDVDKTNKKPGVRIKCVRCRQTFELSDEEVERRKHEQATIFKAIDPRQPDPAKDTFDLRVECPICHTVNVVMLKPKVGGENPPGAGGQS